MTAPTGEGFFDYWDRQEAARKTSPTTTTTRPAGAPASGYAAAALKAEAGKVATAANGTRNHVLNAAAFSIAQLVAAGHLDEDHARDTMTAAALTAGLEAREIAATIASAFRAGRQHPREIPERSTPPSPVTVLDETRRPVAVALPDAAGLLARRMGKGGTYVLDVPDHTPAVWGAGTDVLWAEGESLIIAAGNGAGKTTLAGQIVKGRLGLAPSLLGLPITAGTKRTMYLAMDRPRQIARALHRQFTEADRAALDEKLRIWTGPPPSDLARTPELLLSLAKAADADTLVIDSLKDAAIGLSRGRDRRRLEPGPPVRHRRRMPDAGTAHNVKRNATGGEPSTIADVYGSAWITAGVGSVILLVGAPGDPVVKMIHAKQPAVTVGPWNLLHDHDQGVTTIHEPTDIVAVIAARGGITALAAASLMFEVEKPTPAAKIKARRRLDKLTASGELVCVRSARGGADVYEVAR